MALTKQFSKSKPTCKVTFSIPAERVGGTKKVAVLGEFNNWVADAKMLTKQKDGSFKGQLEVETGREYAFRYLLDGSQWLTDTEADSLIWAGIGAEQNGVLSV